MKKISTFILLVCLAFSYSTLAGENNLELTEDQWETLNSGVDYTETYKENEPEEEEEDASDSFSEVEPVHYDLGGFKYIFYVLIAGLVLFVVVKIALNFNSNPTVTNNSITIDSIEEIEEKMHEIDLDQLLKEAIAAQKFRIALRINFLIIIKLLTQNKEIEWAKEKTNWEYHAEIKNIEIALFFKEIVLGFEPVWYGEHQLTKEQFNATSPAYEHLKKQLLPNE